jgi:hypothetical protein
MVDPARAWTPRPTSGTDQTFGPQHIGDYLPAKADIPDAFRSLDDPWHAFVAGWFYEGGDARVLVARPGIDRRAAIGHVQAVLASFAPQHEHKMAGAAYLCALWFEPLGTATYTPPERTPVAAKPAAPVEAPRARQPGKTERGAARKARRLAAHLGGRHG